MTKTVQIPDFVKIIKCFWYKISSNHLEKKKKIKVEAKEKSIPSSKVKSKSPDIENSGFIGVYSGETLFMG